MFGQQRLISNDLSVSHQAVGQGQQPLDDNNHPWPNMGLEMVQMGHNDPLKIA